MSDNRSYPQTIFSLVGITLFIFSEHHISKLNYILAPEGHIVTAAAFKVNVRYIITVKESVKLPVVFEQNDFNANTVVVLNTLRENAASPDMSGLSERLDMLQLENKKLALRVEKLERENEQLRGDNGKSRQS